MTKKQYNQIVNECRRAKCYHCGCKEQCDILETVISTPIIKFYSELTTEERTLIKECGAN